jgi:hypothetical protein
MFIQPIAWVTPALLRRYFIPEAIDAKLEKILTH